jgi:predicted DsbA family dithiol-disulfide isomerase
VVERLKTEYGAGVHVEWLPFLLRPDMPEEGEELPANIRAKAAQSFARLQQMAQAQGLPMVNNMRMPNPRRAHEATEYAREKGKGEPFHRAVFRLFYGEGRDISDWAVLHAAALEVGLDADDMQRAVTAGTYRQVVEQSIADAHALGINSVPTYVLNDRYAIIGAQPYQVFQEALARLQAEQSD